MYGSVKFVSSNDREINNHISNHLEASRKASELNDKKRKEELSLKDEDIYEGFDKDGLPRSYLWKLDLVQ